MALGVVIALAAGCAREEAVVGDADLAAEPEINEPVVVDTEGLAAPDAAGDVATFGRWDASRDGMIDTNEFNTGFTQGNWFHDWDADNDGMLNETEFQTVNAGWGDAPGGIDENGFFDTWDADEDGLIDNDEFNAGAYSAWDMDSNNMIDTNEYNAGANWFGWG